MLRLGNIEGQLTLTEPISFEIELTSKETTRLLKRSLGLP